MTDELEILRAALREHGAESTKMQAELHRALRELENLRERLHRQDASARRLREFALWVLTPEAFGRSIQSKILDMARHALGEL